MCRHDAVTTGEITMNALSITFQMVILAHAVLERCEQPLVLVVKVTTAKRSQFILARYFSPIFHHRMSPANNYLRFLGPALPNATCRRHDASMTRE